MTPSPSFRYVRKNRGLTLIELILVVAVGSILVVGLVLFARSEIENTVRVRDFLIAMNLARLEMAVTENQPSSSLAAGTYDYPSEANFPGFKIRRIITLLTQTTMPDSTVNTLWQVDMIADYATGNFSAPLFKLITYRQNHATFLP